MQRLAFQPHGKKRYELFKFLAIQCLIHGNLIFKTSGTASARAAAHMAILLTANSSRIRHPIRQCVWTHGLGGFAWPPDAHPGDARSYSDSLLRLRSQVKVPR